MVDPWQTELVGVDMVTETGRMGRTVTGYWALGAGLLVVHNRLEVNVQETRSPSDGVYVKVFELVPEGVPLTYH